MKKLRIAAMGDLHIRQGLGGTFKHIFEEVSSKADILLFCGDLTDSGLPDEANILTEELSLCKIPIVGVLGNHDYTSDQQDEVKKILSSKMFVLDEQTFSFKDVGFAGTKGFAGGFGDHIIAPFGERALKQFVFEAIEEVSKLDKALESLKTDKKIVALHYSPILQTVIGEPPEIYPMLGTSRLIEPIENHNATVVFHAHAHHGTPKGKTLKGIPVYNVALSLLRRTPPNQPYIIVEV